MANILQMLKPDGTVKVLVEAPSGRRSIPSTPNPPLFMATATPLTPAGVEDHEIEAMRRAVVAQFDQFVKLEQEDSAGSAFSIAGIEDAGRLADTIAAHLPLKLEQKQEISKWERASASTACFPNWKPEIDIPRWRSVFAAASSARWRKSASTISTSRSKAIQKELGEGEEGADLEELDKKIKAAGMSKEGLAKAQGSNSRNCG